MIVKAIREWHEPRAAIAIYLDMRVLARNGERDRASLMRGPITQSVYCDGLGKSTQHFDLCNCRLCTLYRAAQSVGGGRTFRVGQMLDGLPPSVAEHERFDPRKRSLQCDGQV